jgi:glycosyltransferase involved in cell wall biosynthesis
LRIAVDANCLAWGWSGIPKHVDRIVRELARRPDVELDLLANSDRSFAEIEGTREAYARRRGGWVWRNTFVTPWLKRNGPDVFWAPETALPWFVPVPAVVTVHDLAPLLLPGIKPRRHHRAFDRLLRRSVRAATRVIAVSETTAADARRLWGLPEEKLRVVPNGVDERFAPGDEAAARAAVATRFGLDEPYVLAVGVVEPRKGLDVLVEAARAQAWRLVLVGDAGFRGERILADAKAAGARHLGRVEDDELVELYRGAIALAAPARYEGFGLTPLEAMACGTPAVIAAGSGGLEEVSGKATVVVADRTPTAWREGIREAQTRRGELREPGLRLASRYRWPHVAAATLEVLREAAADPRA